MAIRNTLIDAYGLNSPGKNLLEHAGNHDYSGFNPSNSHQNIQINYDNINNYIHITQNSASTTGAYRYVNNIESGKIYNLSFYVYSEYSGALRNCFEYSTEIYGFNLTFNANKWNKCWITSKAVDKNIVFYVKNTSYKIRNIKLTECTEKDCYFFQYIDINDELKPFVYNFKDLQTNCRYTEYFTDDNPINELISWENFKYPLKEFVEYEEWQYSDDKSYRTRNTISIIDWCDGSNKSSVSNIEREDATIEYGTPELTLVVNDIPASGGTAAITSSASRSRIQNYTSGDTSKLSNEIVTPSLSITGSGFSLSGSNVIVANRTTTEGSSRTGSVTATYGGVSKSIALYQAENKLTGVTITGSTSDGTVMNISADGGKVTWTPKVQYSSGSNVTPPSGVSIKYSLNYTNIGASQSGNVTTWENRSTIIGAWRGVDVTASATSSYTTKAVTGTEATGKIGSWTYSVKVTQKAGMIIGRLYLHVPVNVGYIAYWTIYVNSTSGGQIWTGHPETSGSANNILKMPEECAIIVAQNGGTVTFSTSYSTATDRTYRGSISGTEQDRLADGEDITVYLT